MGNAGSMDSQQTDFRAHNVPLKLPMPEPGELEERFAIVLVSTLRPGAGPRGAGGADDPRFLGPEGEAHTFPIVGSLPRISSVSLLALSRLPGWGEELGPGYPAGHEPIVWRERHLAARVPGGAAWV